jgi:tungstate transport system ATP-binding protein
VSEPLIRVRNLQVFREGRSICSVGALDLTPGDRLLVQGANGSGKTTLLRVLAGLERDYDGQCEVCVPEARCVYVHQAPYMLRGTVLDNVTLGLRGNGQRRHDLRERASRLIDQIGLISQLDTLASRLSGGEQRRVAIVRALAAAPALLLLDEPFADLDEHGGEAVRALLASKPEMTIVIAAPGDTALDEGTRIHRLEHSAGPIAR